uniref:C-type lectin domain-containing protein n=1 Tax=Astyanax mexicanus TaxID=7994 RepID=A0A8B9LFG3_ASTMX
MEQYEKHISLLKCQQCEQTGRTLEAALHHILKIYIKLFVIYSKCLLLTGLLALSSCLSRQYYFVNQTKQWTDAQTYCRQIYTDLATLDNANDQNSVLAAVNNSGYTGNGQIWIGQYEDVTRLWSDQSNSIYENWKSGEPNNMNGNEHCTTVWFYYSGMWNDSPCNYAYPFVCYRENKNV